MRSVSTSLLLMLPFALLAQTAPRQLSDEQLAALARSMEKSRESSINAQQAAARRQDELRNAREREAAFNDDDGDWQDDPPAPVSTGGLANVLEAFTGTLASEMTMKQQQDAQQQQFLANVRREAEAVDRQRRREQEAQRLAEERVRREREQQAQASARQTAGGRATAGAGAAASAGPVAGADGQRAAGSAAAAADPAAQSREAALRTNVAAERRRLEDAREQAAAAERLRVMRSSVGTTQGQEPSATAPASVSATPRVTPAAKDHGPAKAWCQASDAGTYQCMGPLQNLLSWYPSLDVALSQAGCPGGEGYPPTRGHGGASFNCGRPLKVNDYRMPTYDPYRGGGRPQLVKMGE